MRKFLNLNEQENNIWTEEEMKELHEAEQKNGLYLDLNFEEWLNIKKKNDFEEVK